MHDPGDRAPDGVARPFAAGMALTVEPGLYFPVDDEQVPADLRGVGVRVEDTVVVTADGHEVLSEAIPYA